MDQMGELVVIHRDELEACIRQTAEKAAEIGARSAMEHMGKLRKQENKKLRDRRLRNTELLLRNYKMLKLHADEGVFSVEQTEDDDLTLDEIIALMSQKDDDQMIQSIRESKMRTTIIIRHVDTMLKVYRIYAETCDDPLEYRRYQLLYDRYIADKLASTLDLSLEYHISKEQVYRDLRVAKERVSALIFGIEGLEK